MTNISQNDLAQYMGCKIEDLEVVEQVFELTPQQLEQRKIFKENMNTPHEIIQLILEDVCEQLVKQGVLKFIESNEDV